MIHLRREIIIRLGRLLEMRYRPSELADEIGCHVDTVYRSYIPAGCPHTRDETGHIWIVGTEFAEWAREVNSREGVTLEDGEAYCLKCEQPIQISDPITVRPTNRHLELLSGACPQCGTTVNRARRRSDTEEMTSD
jgi:RNase P subunit RPR2